MEKKIQLILGDSVTLDSINLSRYSLVNYLVNYLALQFQKEHDMTE